MTQLSEEREFLYNGSALAAGGHFTHPAPSLLPPQASAVLPIVGGSGQVQVTDFSMLGPIQVEFASAVSSVSGSETQSAGERVFNTEVKVIIDELNVGGLVTADRVVARLVSSHAVGGAEIPFFPAGSHFVNLMIAGRPVTLLEHDALFAAGTLPEIATECRKSGAGPVGLTGAPLTVSPSTHTLTSLYAPAQGLSPRAKADRPWGITIPGFGVVYLGEYVVSQGARRLTMIRIVLAGSVGGSMQLGYVGGNGTLHP